MFQTENLNFFAQRALEWIPITCSCFHSLSFDTLIPFIIMNMNVDKFIEQQLELLQLEHEAEINESR